jgi:hypothetical protein
MIFSLEGNRGIQIVKKLRSNCGKIKHKIGIFSRFYWIYISECYSHNISVGCSFILEQVLRFSPHTAHTVSPGQLLHLAAKGAALLEFISIKSDLKHNKFLNYAQTARA